MHTMTRFVITAFPLQYVLTFFQVPLTQLKSKRKQDDVEIVGEDEENDAFAMYYADVNKHQDREPVFHPELGLAVESLPEGITLEMLWQCVN